jgi:hypothetical protein
MFFSQLKQFQINKAFLRKFCFKKLYKRKVFFVISLVRIPGIFSASIVKEEYEKEEKERQRERREKWK